MSTFRLTLAFAAVIAMTTPSSMVHAQIVSGIQTHPRGPFIEPDTFQPDFQFFAPADVTDYTQHPKASTGFYFQYERLYMSVSQPENSVDGDFTWGNRLEAGFMDDSDRGWGFVAWHIDGPNEDRTFSGDEGPAPTRFDGTNLVFIDTVNRAKYASVELNRYFERHYLHNHAVLEPFVGLRFTQFKDLFTRTGDYLLFDTDVDGTLDTDLLIRSKGTIENNMLGAVFGTRIVKDVGHWQFNTELRGFVMQNWQLVNARTTSSSTSDVGSLILPPPVYLDGSDQATVYGGELKMNVAYKLTRDISFDVGFALINYGIGVGRAGTAQPTYDPNTGRLGTPVALVSQQDVFMGGVTFGLQVNR
jgi:hypothetical protein